MSQFVLFAVLEQPDAEADALANGAPELRAYGVPELRAKPDPDDQALSLLDPSSVLGPPTSEEASRNDRDGLPELPGYPLLPGDDDLSLTERGFQPRYRNDRPERDVPGRLLAPTRAFGSGRGADTGSR